MRGETLKNGVLPDSEMNAIDAIVCKWAFQAAKRDERQASFDPGRHRSASTKSTLGSV
jgi:hypothetical protein